MKLTRVELGDSLQRTGVYWGCAAVVGLLVAAALARRRRRLAQTQKETAGGALGLGRGGAARAARRCHSITILTESEPLLMERGVEFFGRPRSSPKQKQRQQHPRNALYTQALGRHHMARRVLTAPSAALSPALLRPFTVGGPAPPSEPALHGDDRGEEEEEPSGAQRM
ncbi:hypothetical protein IWQ56_001968 [Coemansia nantahalensis]|nr:hypothetical protein IWQ56_001968 [Coemansia nantahalensis]